jgi:hypothetical protein
MATEWPGAGVEGLRRCGLNTRTAVYARVRNGRLRPLHAGVYAVGHANPPFEGRLLPAVRACGEHAVLSHFSAAALWGSCPGRRGSPK